MSARPTGERFGVPARLALFAAVLLLSFGVGAAIGGALPDLHADDAPAVTADDDTHDSHAGGDR